MFEADGDAFKAFASCASAQNWYKRSSVALYFLGSSWCRPPTEHSVRAMAMAGFHEVRHVRSETTAKTCSGVPAPAGRLYGVGESRSQPRSAVAFRFHGTVLEQPGGFETGLECRLRTF